MTDLYKTPNANLEINTSNQDLRVFKRFSAWGVFFLGVITVGIYSMYWLYSRTKVLNSLTGDGISKSVINIALVAYVADLVSAYAPYLFHGVQWLQTVNVISAIIFLIFLLVWVFSFRSIIVQIARANGVNDFRANAVLTFFFQVIYLQYKINQYIDTKEP